MFAPCLRNLTLLALLSLLSIFPVLAASGPNTVSQASATSATSLTIYSGPSAHSTAIEILNAPTLLVPIIMEGQWLKVGDTANGNVGWVNKNDFNIWLRANGNALKNQFLQILTSPNSREIYQAVEALTDGQVTQKQAQAIVQQWQSPQGQIFQQMMFRFFQQQLQNQPSSGN